MGYIDYAISEFKTLGWMDENGNYDDGMQEAVCKNVLELLEVFAKEGYSGGSFGYAVNLFRKLAHFHPLSELTGEDDEWRETETGYYQNKRYSAVFKKDGKAYDIHGQYFKYGDDGAVFSAGRHSHKPVEFPYMPPFYPPVVVLPKELEESGGLHMADEEALAKLGIKVLSEEAEEGGEQGGEQGVVSSGE